MRVDPYLYRQPCEHVLAPTIDSVRAFFSCRGERFAAIVPAPLLVLDAVQWTASVRSAHLKFAREAADAGDAAMSREFADTAEDVAAWLDNANRWSRSLAPLALRQRLEWPTVTFRNVRDYARYIRWHHPSCSVEDIQVVVHTRYGRVHVDALPSYFTILSNTGTDGMPRCWCGFEMPRVIDRVKEGWR